MAKAKYFFIFSILIVFIFFALSNLFVPTYFDEISFKASYGRLFFNDYGRINLLPQCNGKLDFKMPEFYLIHDALISFFYSITNHPLWNRIYGTLGFIFLFFITLKLFTIEIKRRSQEKLIFQMIISSFFFIGCFPWLLALNRPEQNINICLVLLLLLGKKIGLEKERGAIYFFYLILMIVIGLFCLAEHPKTLLITPFFIILFLIVAKNNLERALSVLTIITAIFVSYKFEATHICEDAPKISSILNTFTIKPGDLLEMSFYGLAQRAYASLKSLTLTYNTTIQESYQSFWLPLKDIHLQWPELLVNKTIHGMHFFIKLFILIYAQFKIVTIFKKRVIEPNFLIFLSLCFSYFLLIFMYNSENFYESSLKIFILILLFLMVLSDLFDPFSHKIKKIIWISTFPIYSITLFSFFLMSYHFYQSRENLSNHNYRPVVHDLIDKCNPQKNKSKQNIVIDGETISYLWSEIKLPIFAESIGPFFGQDIKDQKVFLEQFDVSMIITKCSNIPTPFTDSMVQKDNLCCVNMESTF